MTRAVKLPARRLQLKDEALVATLAVERAVLRPAVGCVAAQHGAARGGHEAHRRSAALKALEETVEGGPVPRRLKRERPPPLKGSLELRRDQPRPRALHSWRPVTQRCTRSMRTRTATLSIAAIRHRAPTGPNVCQAAVGMHTESITALRLLSSRPSAVSSGHGSTAQSSSAPDSMCCNNFLSAPLCRSSSRSSSSVSVSPCASAAAKIASATAVAVAPCAVPTRNCRARPHQGLYKATIAAPHELVLQQALRQDAQHTWLADWLTDVPHPLSLRCPIAWGKFAAALGAHRWGLLAVLLGAL